MPDDDYLVMTQKNKGTNSLPFSSNLREIMKDRGLTLKDISLLAGVRTSVVQNWVEGKNPHDLMAVNHLSKRLGIPLATLLLSDEEEIKTHTIEQMFSESEFTEGIFKISIKKLSPKRSTEK